MNYLARFEGTYEREEHEREQRIEALVSQVVQFEPENLDELLERSQGDEVYYNLDFVRVRHPLHPENEARFLYVRPSLELSAGYDEEGGKELDKYDKGIGSLILQGLTPGGEAKEIGSMTFFRRDGNLIRQPILYLQVGPEGESDHIRWESFDAEVWLSLAKAALEAQPQSSS